MTWALLLLSGWLAATVSGVAGFGGALLLLPILTHSLGPGKAISVLTLAQLLGNLSRAGFGWREIRWRPALAFGVGAVPACVSGARLFVALDPSSVLRCIGVFLLMVVALRHTPGGRRPIPAALLAPAGLVVGLISAVAGSAGPLGATVFLGLGLPAGAYVATEAVTAVMMHLTKSLVYNRFGALTAAELIRGLALGGAMMAGSWIGRRLIERLPEHVFDRLIEVLLVLAAVPLILGHA
jgi:uncharacterized membrane protein YfcA